MPQCADCKAYVDKRWIRSYRNQWLCVDCYGDIVRRAEPPTGVVGHPCLSRAYTSTAQFGPRVGSAPTYGYSGYGGGGGWSGGGCCEEEEIQM
jgi:hypothetical protein